MSQPLALAGERATLARTPLMELVASIEAACEGRVDDLQCAMLDALALAACAPGLLTPAQRAGSSERYARHLLHGDARGRFAIVSLVWQPGQRTPVHSHYTWCGYAVVEGALHEETFAWPRGGGAARCTGAAERRAGYACFGHAGVETIHGLRNRSSAAAVSVHVYGVDAPRVATHVNRVLAVAD
jgi:predicted metal-dependent enzyme (double-stranded beta helix superfamily)